VSEEFDLIIIGAGTSGMAAAIAAGERGGYVALLDAAESWGGTLHVASGWLSGAGTTVQRERGITDTPEEHLEDLVRISKGTIDATLAAKAVVSMPRAVDWLVEHGYELSADSPMHGFNHEPYRKPRYYVGANMARSILTVLDRELRPLVETRRVDFRPRTDVVDLVMEGDRVVGVMASSPDGLSELRARSVVMATGGYNSDPELFASLSGRTLYARDSYPHALGAGHRLGLSAGGFLRGAENFWCSFGSVLESFDYPSPTYCRPEHRPEVRQPWEITVNLHGERFVAEDDPSVDAREAALMAQPEQRRFTMFDEEILESAPPMIAGWTADDIRRHSGEHPMFHSADSVEALAEAMGVPPQALRGTVEEFNRSRDGADPWGRVHRPRPISRGPFYAIAIHGTSVTSAAGLAVDEHLRVLREDGEIVKGLYAVGELLGSGQLQGSAFCGGMLATPALAFGFELGATLACRRQDVT
jgi:fumarate reductase flavoprotein subunit